MYPLRKIKHPLVSEAGETVLVNCASLRRGFGVSPGLGARWNLTKLEPMLEAVHDRLSPVVIECLPWADFVDRYDRPGTLFYCDPPYFGCERDYGDDTGQPLFDRSEFEAMAERFARLRGNFILSLNDHVEVRRIFSGFRIEAVETTYTVGGGGNAKSFGEVIITAP